VAKEEVLEVKGKRGNMSKAVLALILDSPEGITTTELEEKTGLKDRQIWRSFPMPRKEERSSRRNVECMSGHN